MIFHKRLQARVQESARESAGESAGENAREDVNYSAKEWEQKSAKDLVGKQLKSIPFEEEELKPYPVESWSFNKDWNLRFTDDL